MANKGFEFAFKGSMKAYKILANKAVFWLGHVTGTGGESEAHYWANDCDTCKEIAKFISDWSSLSQPTKRAPDKCPRCDGRGKVRSTSNSDVTCPLCKGAGSCR